MPTISKKTKIKKVAPKSKTSTIKTKSDPVKKKVVKKKVVKKTKKPVSRKANQIVVDIISDDENNISGFAEVNKTLEPEQRPVSTVFSSWSNFERKIEPEDILSEVETDDNEAEINNDQDNLDYDKQKNFFSDWAKQNALKEGEEKPNLAPKKSIGLYRRQAFLYLGATLILVIGVAYFFFTKLTVLISPQGETINDSISFSVVSDEVATTVNNINKRINGKLQVVEVSAEKYYQTTSEEISSDETSNVITGTVTLINKYNKNQPLVATTRLLSPDGKLFRLKDAVNIPAGGTITASVYADKAGADMEVAANTRFTIPGLWAGIQDRIYAENPDSLNYQSQFKKIVKQSDLDRATKDINEVLDLKIKNELKISDDEVIVYGDSSEEIITNFDVKIGDKKDSFTVNAKKSVVVVTFSKNKVAELAKARLLMIVSDDKQLSNFNVNQITYTLESFDEKTKTAEIKAYFTGLAALKSDSSLIDEKKLVGLNEVQISQYLNSFPDVKDYKLEFWPPFIKNAPNLPDRIEIKIEEQLR